VNRGSTVYINTHTHTPDLQKMLTASPTTALCYLLIYYAIYSLHSILPMIPTCACHTAHIWPLIPTCPCHTAHIWPYCSSHWWL